MNLKKKIHNELINERETKKQSLIIETRIVNSQLRTLKNCDSYDCLIENLIKKVSVFKERNFSDAVITESVFDILTSLFGELDDSFWNETKSRLADHLINNLNIDEDLKDCVKEEILKTPNDEITKLMGDADFVSDKIATSYIECFQNKVLSSGVDRELGPVGKELRAAISNLLSDSGFLGNISGKINSQISDTLTKIQQKDKEVADEIKSTVIGS